MRITRVLPLLVLLSVLFSVGCGEDSPDSRPVAESVSEQLGYLEPQSSLVAAVDLRFAEENWEHVQTLVSRGLREYRNVDPDAGLEVPPNRDGALNQAAGFAGLSFEDDVEPLLDGYLVVGLTLVAVEPGSGAGEVEREQRTVVTYRTESDGMQEVIGKLTEGDELRWIPGHDGALLIDSSSALIGGDTIVFVDAPDGDGPDGASDALLAALDRAESGKGFSADELETAQEETGSTDPLILSAGDLSLGGLLIEGPGLRRAIEEVPLLDAVALSGPDRVVFGMIGDDFVVGSDREQVSEIADIETEKYPDEAASATTVPASVALAATDEVAGELASRLIGDLSVSASGDRSGVDIDLVLPFAGD